MNVGIISFAHMHAYSYASALKKHDDVKISVIYDEDEARGRKAAELFNAHYVERLDDLLKTDVDAVIVTSENSKHCAHVLAAAAAGKHILCEKPIATTIEDAQKMIECCAANHVILQIAFPVRFSTPVMRAKKLVEDGAIGQILAIKGTNRGTNPKGWFLNKSLSGGGSVMDHTVHVVDLMRWFLHSEVSTVYAEIDNKFISEKIDDCGILSLNFKDGTFATLDCSWSRNDAYPTWGDVTMELIGTKGSLNIRAFDQKLDVYSKANGAEWNYWGDDMDQGLIDDFIDTVVHDRRPSITGEDGLRAMQVALSAYRSSEMTKTIHVV